MIGATRCALWFVVALLAACATPEKREALVEAAVTPLADLNVIHTPIPPVLAAAKGAPYAPPAETTCAALASAIDALDEVLGNDVDAPARASADPDLIQRGVRAADKAALDAVRGAVDVVPYRGWVRKLTGAERDSKKIADAIRAGTLRRAFLKGVRQQAGCGAVVTPL